MPRTAGLRGRLPVKPPGERFAIKYIHEYLSEPLPAPVYPVDVSGGITDFLMLGNGPDPTCTTHPSGVGDCTFAGRQHVRMCKAAADDEPMPSETSDELVAEYLLYDHGQDQGAVIADLLLAWYTAGKILAFAPADHTDRAQCDAAMQQFRGLYLGADLTDDADQRFQDGQPWTVADGQQPDPGDGHCVVRIASTGSGPGAMSTDATWGARQESTAAWDSACVTESWVIVTSEDQMRPEELAALRADIDALHGTGGNGSPAPAPAPDPAGLLAEVARLVRAVAASADRDIAEVVAFLHSHSI